MHDSLEIERLRPARNELNSEIPYHFLQEQEPDAAGMLQRVNTVFLTSKECSFKCLMCDLWKNTLPYATPPGAVLKQINYALERLPEADIIKLYNSGNFFDLKAVPPSDYQEIARRLRLFKRVIVENHPNLCGKACVEFKQMLNGSFEVALGLETIHPEALPRLNKQLTPDDFRKAAHFLKSNGIYVRAFILLNPPYLTEVDENIEWTYNTVKFAFDSGADCCSIIPTRSGNGIMEKLFDEGAYIPPLLTALEDVFDMALNLRQGRVFVDTWDSGFLSKCPHCFSERMARLEKMNLTQNIIPRVTCNCQN
ncbi:MAG TPA: hypothetical protein VHA56_09550 [Mucilaginibacter sp.]|nr:hypothetical protein [Mucilaginibacter sp.]